MSEQQQPGKRRPNWLIFALAGVSLLVLCCVGSCVAIINSGGDEKTPDAQGSSHSSQQQEQEEEPVPAATTPELPAGTVTQRGLLLVGTDIQPGVYRGVGCSYWARLSDASGDFDAILANGNIASGEVLTVTLLDTDFGFDNSCRRLYPLDVAPEDALGVAGVLAVGRDIEPGTYSGTPSDHCYWARLSGFTGDFDELIANDNVAAGERFVIDVLASDVGLELSKDCGPLTRV